MSDMDRVKYALVEASTDISEWCQLAERQRQMLPDADHNPIAPTTSGIDKSRRVQNEIAVALEHLRRCAEELELYRWCLAHQLTVQRAAKDYPYWFVADVDNDVMGEGHTPRDAMADARHSVEYVG